jgi:heat shock protein HslJ
MVDAKQLVPLLVALTLAMVLGSCVGYLRPAAPSLVLGHADIEWELTALTEGGATLPVPEGTQITVEFEASTSRERGVARGAAGCSRYSTAYGFDGSHLAFETPITSETVCDSPSSTGALEERYFYLLRRVTGYRIEGDRLWLKADGERALVFAVQATGYNSIDLIDDLRAAGVKVERTGQRVDHGFAVEGQRVLVDDAPLYVYEFPDTSATVRAAEDVSADEYSLTITRVDGEKTIEVHSDWLETPHLYSKGRLILVLGENPVLLEVLDTTLGPPFMPMPHGAG